MKIDAHSSMCLSYPQGDRRHLHPPANGVPLAHVTQTTQLHPPAQETRTHGMNNSVSLRAGPCCQRCAGWTALLTRGARAFVFAAGGWPPLHPCQRCSGSEELRGRGLYVLRGAAGSRVVALIPWARGRDGLRSSGRGCWGLRVLRGEGTKGGTIASRVACKKDQTNKAGIYNLGRCMTGYEHVEPSSQEVGQLPQDSAAHYVATGA